MLVRSNLVVLRPKVWAVVSLINVIPVLVVVCQALTNELFAAVANLGLLWEDNFSCIQDSLISNYSHLRFVLPERFNSEKQLVEDDTD